MNKKMKIRIRTFVFGINHGQLLQAIGMANLLRQCFPNHSVKNDLYHNHILKEVYAQLRKLSVLKSIVLISNWLFYVSFGLPWRKRHATIFGADTIWMYNHPVAPNDFYFFGKGINEGQLISVCPSNAGSPYPNNENLEDLLQKFEFVGVRDDDTKAFARGIVSKDVNIVCDPAFFILHPSNSVTEIRHREDKIAVYANSFIFIMRELEQSEHKEVHNINKKINYLGYFPNFWTNISTQVLGVFGVLKFIGQSKLVITDTFHGVIMALMTRTPFILVKSDIVMSRLEGPIMNCFGHRRICNLGELTSLLIRVDLYDVSDLQNGELEEFISFSKQHITQQLKKLL